MYPVLRFTLQLQQSRPWQKARHVCPENRRTPRDLPKDAPDICDRGAKLTQRRRGGAEATGHLRAEQWASTWSSHLIQKLAQNGWLFVCMWNVKHKTFRRKQEKHLWDWGFGEEFTDLTIKPWSIKQTTERLVLFKMKTFTFVKDPVKIKRQAINIYLQVYQTDNLLLLHPNGLYNESLSEKISL